jgi:hypothetical protein
MKMTYLFDLDELFADFTGGALALHGLTRDQMEAGRTPGHWNFIETLGMSPTEFWKPITASGETFWSSLCPLPWFSDLLHFALDIAGNDWYIITTPSMDPGSYSGKVKWMKEMFGSNFNRFLLTPHKHLLAQPGFTLIDDREETCQKFKRHGGSAVTFPSMGNSQHVFADQPVDYLRNLFSLPL